LLAVIGGDDVLKPDLGEESADDLLVDHVVIDHEDERFLLFLLLPVFLFLLTNEPISKHSTRTRTTAHTTAHSHDKRTYLFVFGFSV
jgi:hypothetical protein